MLIGTETISIGDFRSQSHAQPYVLIPDCVVVSFNVPFREVRAIPHARSYLSYFGVRFPSASGVRIEFVFFSLNDEHVAPKKLQFYHVLPIFIIASPFKMAMFIHFGAPATPWFTFYGPFQLRKPCWRGSVTSKMGWPLGSPFESSHIQIQLVARRRSKKHRAHVGYFCSYHCTVERN